MTLTQRRSVEHPRGFAHLGCIRSKSSLQIWGMISAWVVLTLVVLSRSLWLINWLLVLELTGRWFLMNAKHPCASCSFLKYKSNPCYAVSTLRAFSVHFCRIRFCSSVIRVRLWLACCLTWISVFQSWGVKFFLQSGHCEYFSINSTISLCCMRVFSLMDLMNSILILILLEWGSVQINLASLSSSLAKPFTFLRSMPSSSGLSL